MTKNLNTATIAALAIAGAMGLAALPQTAAAQPFTYQGEVAAHPNIASAIRKMESAYADLQAAPANFGGNKAQAMAQVKAAIHSLRRALFYRLKATDAQIDAYRF
jgi:hypothetical protein